MKQRLSGFIGPVDFSMRVLKSAKKPLEGCSFGESVRTAVGNPQTHFIHILSADTSATQGLRTLAASLGNCLLSQEGSETSQKSRGLFFSLYSRLLSRSCSANASFCTSCSMKSALASTAYQVACRSSGAVRACSLPAYTFLHNIQDCRRNFLIGKLSKDTT